MVWIFAAVVLCLLVLVPEFRKFAGKFTLVAAVILGVVIFLVWANDQSHKDKAEETVSYSQASVAPAPPPKRIATSQIRVTDLHWQMNGTRQISSVSARIYNESATDSLSSLKYRLLIDDCRAAEQGSTTCTTLHDQQGTISVSIPPNQARDASINVPEEAYRVGPTILGKPKLHLNILDAEP